MLLQYQARIRSEIEDNYFDDPTSDAKEPMRLHEIIFCIQWCQKEMRLSVHFRQLCAFRIRKLINLERTPRIKSIWNFDVDYNGLCLKILGSILEKFQR